MLEGLHDPAHSENRSHSTEGGHTDDVVLPVHRRQHGDQVGADGQQHCNDVHAVQEVEEELVLLVREDDELEDGLEEEDGVEDGASVPHVAGDDGGTGVVLLGHVLILAAVGGVCGLPDRGN